MIYSLGSFLVLVFTLYCVLDVALTDRAAVRTFPKIAWVLLVVFVPVLGGAVWLFAGRPTPPFSAGPDGRGDGGGGRRPVPGRDPRGGGPRDTRPPGPRQPPRGPDDDPDFLRRLDQRRRRRDDA